MRRTFVAVAVVVALSGIGRISALAGEPFGTAFVYQGQLKLEGLPVNDSADFAVTLWDAEAAGTRIGSVASAAGIQVVNGLFTITLDFGAAAFNGEARWIQIDVRSPAGSGSYVTLTPRQRVTPVPYALALSDLRTIPNGTSPSILAGWRGNSMGANVLGGTLSGGGSPLGGGIPRPNNVTDNYSTISGGSGNIAGDNDADATDSEHATVGGGYANQAGGPNSTVAGGWYNRATGSRSTAAGGWSNLASADASTVSGGRDNTASGSRATVPGGADNRAQGDYTLAAGRRAKADHQGAFVWADSTDADFVSTANNQFVIRAGGGVGVGTAAPKTTLDVEGLARVKGANWPSAGEGMELGYDSTLNRGYIQVYDRTAPGTWGDLYLGNGKVGIGTATPNSKLTVVGTIESTSGGVKFPDGTTQATATVVGPAGPAGYHCWDLNMNRINDPAEDTNHDGAWNIIDCQGMQGATGPQGPPGPPVTTSAVCGGGGQVPPIGYCAQWVCTGTVVAEVRTAVQCSVTADTGSCSSPAGNNGFCCVCAP